MQRKIVRSYSMHDRDVHEAIIAWLKSRDMPAPQYVADTPCTKWIKEPAGLTIEWTVEDEIN